MSLAQRPSIDRADAFLRTLHDTGRISAAELNRHRSPYATRADCVVSGIVTVAELLEHILLYLSPTGQLRARQTCKGFLYAIGYRYIASKPVQNIPQSQHEESTGYTSFQIARFGFCPDTSTRSTLRLSDNRRSVYSSRRKDENEEGARDILLVQPPVSREILRPEGVKIGDVFNAIAHNFPTLANGR
ncbi:hypothetical protein LTR56_025891 [Elasticomyces elasticus]|nr:hypothetical protein LTR56_025891 [Elasticomyces elasticus]KAK5732838.1 hypothetical protein LTS12_027057 [Elasticomyces elasticus]